MPTLIAELALRGAVEIESGKGRHRGEVALTGGPGEPARRDLPDQLCARLAERGILRREESKVLGPFPRTRWPAVDSQHGAGLRAALQRALIGARTRTSGSRP